MLLDWDWSWLQGIFVSDDLSIRILVVVIVFFIFVMIVHFCSFLWWVWLDKWFEWIFFLGCLSPEITTNMTFSSWRKGTFPWFSTSTWFVLWMEFLVISSNKSRTGRKSIPQMNPQTNQASETCSKVMVIMLVWSFDVKHRRTCLARALLTKTWLYCESPNDKTKLTNWIEKHWCLRHLIMHLISSPVLSSSN